MNRNQRMLRTTIIYFIGNFGSKLLAFFLLPIYTNWLSPNQFGKIDLILNILPLIGPIFTLQTTESIFRFLFDCKTTIERKKHITSAFIIYILGFISFLILYIPYCIVSKFEYASLFAMYFFFQYLGIFVQQVMRGFHKNSGYAISGVLSTLIQGVTNIILIKYIAEDSLLVAPILASLGIFAYGFYKTCLYKYIDLKYFDKDTIRSQLRYAVPLIPNQICWWFNGIVGKYIVNFFIGGVANGILAVATKFPNLVSTIMQIYFLAWTENSIYEYNSKDKEKYFSKNLNGLLTFLLFCISGLLLLIKIYFNVAIDDEYYSALYLIPILLFAMLFNSIATFLGSIYTASKKTRDAFSTTIYAALTNVVLSFILISQIGIIGYAISNLISYIVFAIIRYRSVNKICRIQIRIPHKLSLISVVIAILTYFLFNLKIVVLSIVIVGCLFLYYYRDYIAILLKKFTK